MGRPTKFTDRDKAWFKRSSSRYRRSVDTRKPRQRILVVCEGEQTEPNYFEAIKNRLPKHVAEVEIHGEGANTESLVRRAQAIRDKRRKGPYEFDEVWVVFDRDSFPPDDFDNAIHMAEADKIHCAWSNEAFELWYLLHFEYRNTGMVRTEYEDCLSQHLGCPYRKNAEDMFERLDELGGRDQASRRAVRLRSHHGTAAPHDRNPCTTVDKLVRRLLKFRNS